MSPVEAGKTLVKATLDKKVNRARHTYFRSGEGKLLHMTRWSRQNIHNAVFDLSRHGNAPNEAHIKATHHPMEYCKATSNRGWYLKPSRKWDGKDRISNSEFEESRI